ncbi:NUDIX hydrolase [Streptomyces sp. WMMB303]|uniref:NUDIX hydrolase n=1 Tax=Streptomyces sp. WMMB303 TaxID=3034154 RepID=UPI003209B980
MTDTTPESIRLTADVVAVTPDNRVLLIERGWDPYEGHWALPGGHVDPGETAQAAAVRELEEETGVHVAEEDLQELGTWSTPGRDPRGRYVTTAYLAQVPADTQAAADDDARDARWWPLDALPHDLAFDHAEILASARTELPCDDTLTIREGDAARHGGVDITMSFTPEEAAGIGGELGPIADTLHSALWGLATLRTGWVPADADHHADARPAREAGPETWQQIISDLHHRLLPRIEGIRDAAIRRHHEAGGTLPSLARAMDVPKSTAQSRRNTLIDGTPSTWARWATDGGPQRER